MGNCLGQPGDDSRMSTSASNKSPTYRAERDDGPHNSASVVNQGRTKSGKIVTPNPKKFTLDELKSATRNFRPDTVLGEGGFGRVFKGWVDPITFKPSKVGVGIPVAVKKSNPDSLQGLQEWQSEVQFLGKFSHQNLVKLLGYCWEENQFLLVYEYVQKGSLESHLFRRGPEPLSWDTRLKIAIGAARGLTFLHTSEKSVIYRDFKSSNILLDRDFNAKLSDFGLAKFGPVNGRSHITTRVMGTYGYAAPEYMNTGLIALDTNRPTGEQNLVDFAKPSLGNKKKLKRIVDPNMDEEYSITAAFQVALLILKCLEPDPKKRPSMEEVLGTLEKVRSIKYKPKGKKKAGAVHQTAKRPDEDPTYNQRRSPSIHCNINGYSKSQSHSSQQ
ncbi:probable serine/threonine-protein kinase PBL10 isoform X2 [Gastrolobium bilobum]|uniref:probable serine/threonine-protein kinase PBL10 isoform X2 n=1 Tax=Gastrolobium bilobum TaxID=150636 RepID=UPI002AAFAB48|nr:probable serine/threonine-protein kinase PBL10 isoform X2 [Gastrolobium bilobum]